MSFVAVVWCEKTGIKDEVKDFYEVFEDLADADKRYEEVLELPNLHSASIFGKVIRSTDYEED